MPHYLEYFDPPTGHIGGCPMNIGLGYCRCDSLKKSKKKAKKEKKRKKKERKLWGY